MLWAYDFECDKTIEEIILTLNEAGPWRWIWRDKDALGPYISSVPLEGVRARIYYAEGPTYTADFKLGVACSAERSTLDDVLGDLLGKLNARNVSECEGYD